MTIRRSLFMEKANKFAPDPPIPEAWAAVQSIQEPWSQILARCQDGSYKDVYSLGDTKVCSFSDEGLTLMHIVGIDIDNKADGSGKAPITWMEQHVLKTAYQWGSIRIGVSQQGGSPDGYGGAPISTKVENLISKLQPELQKGIVSVTKDYNTIEPPAYGTRQPITGRKYGDFKIWIPTCHGEVVTGYESASALGQYYPTPKYSNIPTFLAAGESPTGDLVGGAWFRDIRELGTTYVGSTQYYNVPTIYIKTGIVSSTYSWEKSLPIFPCFCT